MDANPDPFYNLTGQPWRARVQGYDAPFSLQKSDSFTLHPPRGQASYIRGREAQPLFNDTKSYWRAALPRVGVNTPGVGVTMRVVQENETSVRVRIGGTAPRPAAVAAARTVEAAQAADTAANAKPR